MALDGGDFNWGSRFKNSSKGTDCDDVVLVFEKNVMGNGYIFKFPAACYEYKAYQKTRNVFGNYQQNPIQALAVNGLEYAKFNVLEITNGEKIKDLANAKLNLIYSPKFKKDENPNYIVVKVPQELKQMAYDALSKDQKTNPLNYLVRILILALKLGWNMNAISVNNGKFKCDIDKDITELTPYLSDDSVIEELLDKGLNVSKIVKNQSYSANSQQSVQSAPVSNSNPRTQENRPVSNPKPQEEKKEYNNDNSIDVQLIIDELKKDIVGQDNAIEDIVTNVVINQQIARTNSPIPTSSILIDGPTGTGKTFILKKLTDKLNLPYVINNANSFSTTGYKGANLTDVLITLLDKTNGDLESAEKAIVIFDEFDKLGKAISSSGDDMRKGFQDELLTFMEGQEYNIEWNKNVYTFDTSKLTFIGLGAFTDLRESKIAENEKKKRGSMGFSSVTEEDLKKEYTITAQDYVDAGIKREIVGRFSCITYTNEFDKKTLRNILTNSNSSALKDIKKIGEMNGVKVEVEDEVIDQIVDEAYNMKTGARGLRQVCDSLKNIISMDILLNKTGVVNITSETVEKAKNKMIRKYDIDREGKRV